MMMRSIKYVGAPVLIASFFPRTVHAQEEKPRCPKPSDVYNRPTPKPCNDKHESTELERCIKTCRQEIQPIKEDISGGLAVVSSFIRDGWTTVSANIEYLRGAPQEIQLGAIGVGALAGALLGIRRGLFRKVWYGTLGGLGTAAVIYPKESKEVAREGVQLAKAYATIAYNFVIGQRTCEDPMKKLKYRGGMNMGESTDWLWIKNKTPPSTQSCGDELKGRKDGSGSPPA